MDHSHINKRCAFFNLRKVNRALTSILDNHLRHYNCGINSGQFSILVELTAPKSRNLSCIAKELGLESSSIIRNCAPLIERGYINSSKVNSADSKPTVKRAPHFLTITESGQRVVEKALPFWKAANDELLFKITAGLGYSDYKEETATDKISFLNDLKDISKAMQSMTRYDRQES